MIAEIKRGDTVECLKCKEPILLNDKTFTLDFEGEYISCPSCNCCLDVQAYHIYGNIFVAKERKEKSNG